MDRPDRAPPRFYELSITPIPGTWFLAVPWLNEDGSWKDIWAYTRCERLKDPSPVAATIKHAGRSRDINFASFDIPIMSRKVNDVLEAEAPGEIQRVPVTIDAPGEWEVTNVLHEIDCIDHRESLIQYWPNDHPEKAGKPRGVLKLVIDPDRVEGAQIFRLKGWLGPIIISAKLKAALEAAKFTGLICRAVSR